MTGILCIGDVMLDVHASSGALARGGDIHGRVLVRPGGTSANAAVWAVWAGAAADVIGAVGSDLVGDLLVGSLQARPKNVSPAGNVPRVNPIGTLIDGQPVVGEKTWLLSPCGVLRSPIRRGGLLHVG